MYLSVVPNSRKRPLWKKQASKSSSERLKVHIKHRTAQPALIEARLFLPMTWLARLAAWHTILLNGPQARTVLHPHHLKLYCTWQSFLMYQINLTTWLKEISSVPSWISKGQNSADDRLDGTRKMEMGRMADITTRLSVTLSLWVAVTVKYL